VIDTSVFAKSNMDRREYKSYQLMLEVNLFTFCKTLAALCPWIDGNIGPKSRLCAGESSNGSLPNYFL
jgi:hypothetical protein